MAGVKLPMLDEAELLYEQILGAQWPGPPSVPQASYRSRRVTMIRMALIDAEEKGVAAGASGRRPRSNDVF